MEIMELVFLTYFSEKETFIVCEYFHIQVYYRLFLSVSRWTFKNYRPGRVQYDIHQYGNIIVIIISIHWAGKYLNDCHRSLSVKRKNSAHEPGG